MNRRLSLQLLPVVVCIMMVPAFVGAQAVVIKDTSCTVLDLNQEAMFDVWDSIKVITPSENCNRNVSCHGSLSDQPSFVPPKSGVVFNYGNTGMECLVYFDGEPAYTTSWHQVITPKGNVSLTCHFKDCDGGPGPIL